VISITTPQIYRGPFGVMIPPIDISAHIDSSVNVSIIPNGLQVGMLEVDTRFAQLWDPQPSWAYLRAKNVPIQDDLQKVTEILTQYAPPESLAGLITHPGIQSPIEEKIMALAREPVNQLIRGLRTGDKNLCVQGASGLAGLGVGYTPDGDDWILGSLLAVWLMKSSQEAKRISAAIAEAAMPLTTPISAAWISAASRGECAEPWHNFFDCLTVGNENDIRKTVKCLISQGHSSGASAVAGFLASFNDTFPRA
jgi:hypothetical protein